MASIRKALDRVRWKLREGNRFNTSGDYWERRYRFGGNSGAGSYNRLAHFKAEFLNDFVADQGIRSVIEFGSGDGAQLALAQYPDYTGVDVSHTILERTRSTFSDNPSIRFLHTSEVSDRVRAELSLSLDVIYHLVEDSVFETYMEQVFDASTKFAVIYASNENKPGTDPHVRHREFTNWVEKSRPEFRLVEHIPNPYPYSEEDPHNTSFADFFVFARSM